MDLQRGHAELIYREDMQNGLTERTCRTDLQRGHAEWIYREDMRN